MRKSKTLVETLRREVNELEVVNCELASLRSTATEYTIIVWRDTHILVMSKKVYKRRGNGQVLFLVNKDHIISEYKGTLKDAKQRLENAEILTQQ